MMLRRPIERTPSYVKSTGSRVLRSPPVAQRRVNQGDVVSNKRLGDVLSKIQANQRKRDEEHLDSPRVTLRQKERIRAARALADALPPNP
jgi:hypothetical protein